MQATLGVIAALLAGVVLALGPPPQPGWPLAALGASALFLEAQAVPLPGFGYFSAGPGLVLAALLVPTAGPVAAAFLAVVALLARFLRGGRGLSALADLVPLLACALTVRLLPPAPYLPWLVVPAVYLGLSFPLYRRAARRLPPPEYLDWLRTWRTVALLRWSVVLAAVPLSQLPAVALLFLVPLLLATHRAAENTLFRVQARQAHQVLKDHRYQQEVLDRAHQEIDSARRELEATRHERDRLDELTRTLAELPGLEPALDLVLRAVSLRYRSAAVFMPVEGRLTPVRFVSPDAARLEGSALLGLREPLVEQVFSAGRPSMLTELRGPRLFEAELSALALPLSGAGVLYVGREREPFSPEECRWLSWVAARAGLALATGSRQAAQQAALQASEAERQNLQEQVDLLAALAEGSRAVAAGLDAERVLASFEGVLRGLVPHAGGGVWLSPGAPRRAWGEPLAGAQPLLQAVVEGQRPLLLNEPSRLAVAGLGSALCVPIPRGAILLAAREPGAFSRTHQELLLLLGYQLSLALSNAHHFQAEVETRRQLERSQAQLIQSSKMTAVGQLAAGVAHELNTPLGAITLSVESALAMLAKKPEVAAKRLDRVLDSSRRCQQIVEKLLIYTRLSSSRKVRVTPAQLLGDTLEFFGSQLTEAGFELQTDFQPTPDIEVRQQELQQVLLNLLLNARDAAAEGLPRRLLLSCAWEGEVLLRVRDWGEGIAPENLERVFEPFFTTRPVGSGTGLGLSVSHEIVAQHGGRLEVQSVPGQGALFTVRLAPAPDPSEAPPPG